MPISENLIRIDSTQGEELLLDSQARKDYLPLSINFVTQDNLAYCGVASMVMVLNALEIPAPEAPEFGQYNTFTQDNFFNLQAQQVIKPELVARQGMTLEEMGKPLESHPLEAEIYHGGDVTLDQFRTLVVDNLRELGNFVLVNYLRKTIGQKTGGIYLL